MPGGNSAYSPLPQSNSESDGSSEEELHVSVENRVVNRTKVHSRRAEKINTEQKQNVINYKPLDNDVDVGVTLVKFQSNSDEVSILKPNNNVEIFSTSRKICFGLSLLLCISTTIIFIWILPCDIGSCLSDSNAKNFFAWDKILPGLELYGPISVVPDTTGKTQNVIFLINSLNISEQNFSSSGLISLNGSDGVVNWKRFLNKRAANIDCDLIDVDLDGYNDCLVVAKTFWKTLHSVTGKELWDINDVNSKYKLQLLDFPLVVPDLDGDKVKDFLTSCSFGKSHKNNLTINRLNYIVVVSGKTGTIINNPLQINLCSAIHNLMFENSSVISYTCYNSTEKESLQTINLLNVYNTIKNMTKENFNMYKWEMLHQHQKASNTIRVNGRKLLLENRGHCPEDCVVVVEIKDERKGHGNKTIYSYNNKNAFGITPVVVKSEKLNGFILKFWKFKKKEKLNIQVPQVSSQRIYYVKNNTKSHLRKRSSRLNSSINLDKEMLLESEHEFQRCKRTAGFLQKRKGIEKPSNFKDFNLRVITETVVSITFNDTQLVVANITKDEITQICKKPSFCEPNVNRQKHSILVFDLNGDGRQELITFTSKYVHEVIKTKENNNSSWMLQSRVRVLTL